MKGTIYESKSYVPEIYFSRETYCQNFQDWLISDLPCFALVGESGLGKTNFMCAMAEATLENHFVLFYSASGLEGGLLNAIRDDFKRKFQRERDISYIIKRFDNVASRHNQLLIIFIDALDEYIGEQEKLKAELQDFVYRIRQSSVKLCISCKAFNWRNFVLDKGQIYNRLAKSIYPKRDMVHNPQEIEQADETNIGIWLSQFSDTELNDVFDKYLTIFSLKGQLKGDTRITCQNPLILRLVSEVYHKLKIDLPFELSARQVFDRYWEQCLTQFKHREMGEQLVRKLAELLVEQNQLQIKLSLLQKTLVWSDFIQNAYETSVQLGLIRVAKNKNNYPDLSFGIEKMRSYIYTMQAMEWSSKQPAETAQIICSLLDNSLAVEEIEFYFNTIDKGETPLLTEIARLNFGCFLRLINELSFKNVVLDASKEEQKQIRSNRLNKYMELYFEISQSCFPALCEKIEPHSLDNRVKVKLHGAIMMLSPEIEIGVLNVRLGDIEKNIPQKVAWEQILSQIAKLFEQRLLDESNSPELLQERIWDMLENYPNTWFPECPPPHVHYWQLLGFETVQDIEKVAIEDLLMKLAELTQDYQEKIYENSHEGKANVYTRWCVNRYYELQRASYWLDLLQPFQQYLHQPVVIPEDLFQHLHLESLDATVTLVQVLLPQIIETYRSLAIQNFSEILELLPFFKLSETTIVVEVTRHQIHLLFGHSDFLTLCYITLPSVRLSERYIVYTCANEDSLIHKELERKTLTGTVTTRHSGNKLGQANVSLNIDGIPINESNAILSFTQFPSKQPILDQAYQLLGQEVEYVLGGKFQDWANIGHGTTDNEKLDQWIQQYFDKKNKVRNS